MGIFWAVFNSVSSVFVLLVSVWELCWQIFGLIVRNLDESDWFHINPSPVERPNLGPDPGLSYRMNKLVLRLARLRDLEEALAESDPEKDEGLVDPSGDYW